MVLKIFLSIIVAAVVGWTYCMQGERETSPGPPSKRNNGQTCLVDPLMLPFYLVTFLVMMLLIPAAPQRFLSLFAGMFFSISVYYAVLLCLLPLLRRKLSARACANLWMIPNLLYFVIHIYNIDSTRAARFVIPLPQRWLNILLPLWGTGFLLVLLWQVISHLLYRRHLLQDARMALGKDVLPLWHQVQEQRGIKHLIPLMVSPNVHTPLTIGLYPKQMRLFLPHLDYTGDELKLIFEHEIRHIQRADTRVKAFLGFCTALCWFNPLMWAARRKVSDDLELSCDELVLTDADSATRKQYAELLLDTAGSSRGYTTCLSAAASSLRYRLKNVISPRRGLSGGVIIGIVLFVLLMGQGLFAFADSPDSAQTLIFDQLPSDSVIDHVYFSADGLRTNPSSYGADALTEYLSSLTVRPVYSGNFSDECRRELELSYVTTPGNTTSTRAILELQDNVLFLYVFHETDRSTYAVDGEIDWTYLESCLELNSR